MPDEKPPPKPPINSLDEPFFDEEEETTSPDHRRASVICPRCGGVGIFDDQTVCDVCRGKQWMNKEAWDRWKKTKK